MFQLAWKKKYAEGGSLSKELQRNPSKKISASHSAFLMWEEHCIECSAPDCYNSCTLFVEREDGRCARFVNGIMPIRKTNGGDGFSVCINFRRWGKLETPWPNNPRMHPYFQIRLITLFFNTIEVCTTFVSRSIKKISPDMRLNDVLSSTFHKIFGRISNLKERKNDVDGIFFQIYLQELETQIFQFEIYDSIGVRFREKLELNNGWNDFFINDNNLPKNLSGNCLARLWNNMIKKSEWLFHGPIC